MQQTEQPSAIKTLLSAVSEYLKLLIEDTKLNCVEKLTRLLSVATLFILLTIVTTVVMVFVSIGVSIALTRVMEPVWAFFSVAFFYIVLIVVLYFGRTSLIVNPIARFLSSIILNPPTDNNTEENA